MVRILDEMFPDALITDFEHLVGSFSCSDPGDEHVAAAAVVGKAGALVTFNIKDFPKDLDVRHGIDLRHPDDFFMELVGVNENVAIGLIRRRLALYRSPALIALELGAFLEQNQCPAFGSWIASNSQGIHGSAGN